MKKWVRERESMWITSGKEKIAEGPLSDDTFFYDFFLVDQETNILFRCAVL